MEIVNVLAKWGKPAYAKDNGIAEEYRELLESVETSCGGEVTLIGEVEGLHFLYKDEKGVTVEAELDYDCGVRANAKVNGEEYKNSSSKALKEAKNLAVQILKLG